MGSFVWWIGEIGVEGELMWWVGMYKKCVDSSGNKLSGGLIHIIASIDRSSKLQN